MTTKLTDTALVVLSAACSRDDRAVYPITASLKGGALQKVLQSLLAKGLVEEAPAGKDDTVSREGEEGARLTLRATDAAFAALGIEPEPTGGGAAARPAATADTAAQAPVRAKKGTTRRKALAKAASAPTAQTSAKEGPKLREGTKQAAVIAMLRRPEGAAVAEMVEATGWQPHTTRGFLAGALKKKLGLDVQSEKEEGRGRVYRIAG